MIAGNTACGREQTRSQGPLVNAGAFTQDLCALNQASPFTCYTDMLSLRIIMRIKKNAYDVILSALT